MSDEIYFRPEWTCGKYNADKHVAIVFNLIEGIDYFFEREAADVIGFVLAVGKNGKVYVKTVSEYLQIEKNSIIKFFSKLEKYGILSKLPITKEVICNYRNDCKYLKSKELAQDGRGESYKDSIAEDDYCKAVADYNTVTSVMFELTYRCNENCIHCYNPGATRNDDEINKRSSLQELTLDDYKRIIDEFCDAGLVKASISGGDPFLHPYSWDIIEYLYMKEVAVQIFTNGLKLKGNIQRLANLYPRNVRISLYSGIECVHDAITRVNGSFKKTINVIEQLVDNSVNVTINCPIMTRNVKSYNSVKELSRNYGIEVIFDVTILDSIDGDICATKNLRLSPDELEVVLQDRSVGGYISKDDPESLEGLGLITEDGVPCEAGVSLFCIMPNGDMIPCNSAHLKFGNLKTQHLKDIINTSTSLREWRSIRKAQFIECWKHEYCSYCTFCIGNNYSEHSNPLMAGENNCYIAKIRYNLAKKIKNGDLVNTELKNHEIIDKKLYREYR